MEGSRSALSLRGTASALEPSWRTRTFLWLLQDWQPRLSVFALIGVLISSACLCLALGIAALTASNGVVEVEARYDDVCDVGAECSVSLTPSSDMVPPVYFYYRLTSYGQNSRRYVKSRSDTQLQGSVLTTDDEKDECLPRMEALDAERVQYPCGLIAYTFFNDEFNVTLSSGTRLSGDDWSADAIAWPSDIDTKFKARSVDTSESRIIERDGETLTLPSLDDQGLMVWMRPAALPDFRKLYRVIGTTTLKANEPVRVDISNNFISSSDGKKYVVMSTTSWLGGKNSFIGILFIVCAGLLFAAALSIFLVNKYVPATRRKDVL